MKTNILLSFMFLFLIQFNCLGQGFKHFFKAPAEPSAGIGPAAPKDLGWEFKPTVMLPAFKVSESTREEAEADVSFLASTGGGLTIQRTVWDDAKDKYQAKGVSFSPIILLLSGDTSKEGAVLDASWCGTIGFFNNVFQVGAGYDFGSVTKGRSRWFGVFSIGINLTNN